MIWLFTAFSIWEAVMATFLSCPKMSVNWRRINSMSSSRTMRIISSFLVDIASISFCPFKLKRKGRRRSPPAG